MNITERIYHVFLEYQDQYLHIYDIRRLSNQEHNWKYLRTLIHMWHTIGVIKSIGKKANTRYQIYDFDYNNWRNAPKRYKKIMEARKKQNEN